jgi:hypothetical protein
MVSKEQKEQNVTAFQSALAATPPNSRTKITLSDTYSLAEITPETGQWYFAVKCEKCNGITPALRDESEGKRGNPFSGSGKLSVSCQNCLTPNDVQAGADEVFSVQWT